jgi:hypothetical protein
MDLGAWWRGWLRARAFKRLRKRHGEPPERLGAGQWIAQPGEGPDAGGGDAVMAGKLKMLSAAIKHARRQEFPGRRRGQA